MSEKQSYTRRRLLAVAAATTLAGCTNGEAGGTESTTGSPAGRTSTPTALTTTEPDPSTTIESTRTPETTVSEHVLKTTDIVFRETPQETLKLDLYRPTSGSDHPFFVWAHGGGWIIGDKGERPMFDELVKEGYAVADIQYRLAQEKQYPAAVRDTVAAIKWVRDTAGQYGIDATTGALGGYSAGAHLAALVGLAPDHENFQPKDFKPDVSAGVDAIVGYSGPYDFTVPGAGENRLVEAFFGKDASDERLEEGSPVTHVDGSDPPALLLHGTEDSTVPYRSTTVLADALRNAGVPVQVFTAEGAGHRMINTPTWRKKTLPTQKQFLSEHLSSG